MQNIQARQRKAAFILFGILYILVGVIEIIYPTSERPIGILSFYSRFFWDTFGPASMGYGQIGAGVILNAIGLFK
ncbi:MAG: hypothetical protein EOO18_13885 [Chryseobacterium sp.]|nr:MAG: hypothetical protein EOO18_13885 [Chryseobacterium sp.]